MSAILFILLVIAVLFILNLNKEKSKLKIELYKIHLDFDNDIKIRDLEKDIEYFKNQAQHSFEKDIEKYKDKISKKEIKEYAGTYEQDIGYAIKNIENLNDILESIKAKNSLQLNINNKIKILTLGRDFFSTVISIENFVKDEYANALDQLIEEKREIKYSLIKQIQEFN